MSEDLIKELGTKIDAMKNESVTKAELIEVMSKIADLQAKGNDVDALKANIEFSGLNVATTLIGCSKYDGNGNRDKVLEIILNNSNDMNLFVYDYEQIDNRSEKLMKRMKINAKIDEAQAAMNKRAQTLWDFDHTILE